MLKCFGRNWSPVVFREDDIAGELAGLALEANDGADDVTNDDPELALPVKQKKKVGVTVAMTVQICHLVRIVRIQYGFWPFFR